MLSHQLYFERKLNLVHLWVFGNIAYVHVPDEKQKKMVAKSEKYILVDYSDEQKGYKCYNPHLKQVRVSCDVIFGREGQAISEPGVAMIHLPKEYRDSVCI